MVLQYTSTIITPCLGAISAGIPDASVKLVQMIQSIQGLVMIPATLLAHIRSLYYEKQILFISIDSAEKSNPNGTMARLPEIVAFAEKHNMPLLTVEDLVKYRKAYNIT